MPLKELTKEELPAEAHSAYAIRKQAQDFVYEFLGFLYNSRSYTRLQMDDEMIKPAWDLCEERGLSVIIAEVDNGPLPYTFLDHFATIDEDCEYRTQGMLEWRLDTQYPAHLQLELRDQEHIPLNFLFLKERPSDAATFRRLFNSEEGLGMSIDVRLQGERFILSAEQKNAFTKLRLEVPYLYLGQMDETHHVWGNREYDAYATRRSRLPGIARMLLPSTSAAHNYE